LLFQPDQTESSDSKSVEDTHKKKKKRFHLPSLHLPKIHRHQSHKQDEEEEMETPLHEFVLPLWYVLNNINCDIFIKSKNKSEEKDELQFKFWKSKPNIQSSSKQKYLQLQCNKIQKQEESSQLSEEQIQFSIIKPEDPKIKGFCGSIFTSDPNQIFQHDDIQIFILQDSFLINSTIPIDSLSSSQLSLQTPHFYSNSYSIELNQISQMIPFSSNLLLIQFKSIQCFLLLSMDTTSSLQVFTILCFLMIVCFFLVDFSFYS